VSRPWGITVALVAATLLVASDGQPKKKPDSKPDTAKVATLEDFYGDTGTRFQAALSFYNKEPIPSTVNPNKSGYGIGVDDMFISWKETRLDEDVTVCARECADLEVASTLAYAPTGFIEMTVTDKSPYDPVNPKNDCNGNGSYADAVDDQDCNNNGTTDVVVNVDSIAEPSGEIAVLDRIAPGSPVYRGRMSYSSLYEVPGSVFVQVLGSTAPELTVTYEDRNDGTGARCANALDPSQQGFLIARTTIVTTAGRVDVRSLHIGLAPSTPGDDDGFADANETIDLAVTFANKSGLDLDDIVVALSTSDPKIECISVPVVFPGSALKGAVFTAPPFRFKVGGPPLVQRTSVSEVLRASFTITLKSNKFGALDRVTSITLDLDLTATGGGAPAPFLEDFEGAGLGKFTLQTLDAGKNSLVLSDGYRCQYNDPFGPNPNASGRADCFLGFPSDTAQGVNDWHIQRADAANCNSGRAYTGVQSLRWGTCPPTATTPVRDTTRHRQLDAVATIDPINLPLSTTVFPELTFKHQVSFMDGRHIVALSGSRESEDRGVVQVQLADVNGNPVGNWLKISAYENAYDQQGTDNFANCSFDPVDDGNDEDDYFDPTDPLRRLGPSSTCFPEFVYARAGHTDWRLDFNVNNIGLAKDGPGLQGNQAAGFRNPGTWVQPRFDLTTIQAQRIRLRFLATSIELSNNQTWDNTFQVDNLVADDGWFIDDVRIMEALESPLNIEVDNASFAGLPCPVCTQAFPSLTASPPPPLSGPGQIVTLHAEESTLSACNSGTVQYQFWIDGNLDGIVGNAGDTLLRDWTDAPTFLDAPQQSTRYGVRVRCSSATSCSGGTVLDVVVNCPSTGNAKAAFNQTIRVDDAGVSWPATATVDLVRGNLVALRASGGNYTGTVSTCLANNVTAAAVADGSSPGPGGATYYLVRPTVAPFCNQTPGYTTNHPREAAGRDAEIAASGNACP
jgi:hypothetical protein